MLEANRVVSIDRLIDAIWDDSPPVTSRVQVQICASAIRRALDKIGLSGMLVTRKPGYQLCVNAGVLDTDILDTLVKQAKQATRQRQLATAETILQQAIDLWEGPALADIDNRYVDPFRAAFAERRLMLLEQQNAIKLERGMPGEVISALRTLVAEHPLREPLYGQLMEALYLCGRRAEALRVFQQAAQLMREELGIAPNRRMLVLRDRILNERTVSTGGAGGRGPRIGSR
jgi:DNA-binding SARP family transcriptional activator